jgi:hypothetical protein
MYIYIYKAHLFAMISKFFSQGSKKLLDNFHMCGYLQSRLCVSTYYEIIKVNWAIMEGLLILMFYKIIEMIFYHYLYSSSFIYFEKKNKNKRTPEQLNMPPLSTVIIIKWCLCHLRDGNPDGNKSFKA